MPGWWQQKACRQAAQAAPAGGTRPAGIRGDDANERIERNKKEPTRDRREQQE
jgi:hypothetical protein